jgi:hypothetical protein
MEPEPADPAAIAAEIDRLVDEYRLACLWYLRPDYYPRSDSERVRVLEAIARHGDVAAFRRAARLRQWLSHHSSASSAAP